MKTLKTYMNFLLLEKSRASLRLTTCYQEMNKMEFSHATLE